jgi:hypothetical protein
MTSSPYSRLYRGRLNAIPDFYLWRARVLWLAESCRRSVSTAHHVACCVPVSVHRAELLFSVFINRMSVLVRSGF